eukprot:gene27620-36349_t
MSVDRHCDKCNLEVPRGTVLTTLCVDGMAHHLVDNIIPALAVQPVIGTGFERIDAEIGALRAEVENLRARSFIAQDERIYFFTKGMPGSTGTRKLSIVSKMIQKDYHGRCLFCGEEKNVTKAHIVAGNSNVDYSPFSKPKYRDDLDNFPKYEQCHLRVVNVSPTFPPYCRLLAWRSRKCIMEHEYLISAEIVSWIEMCNFSEKSHSIVNEAAEDVDTESNSKESGL